MNASNDEKATVLQMLWLHGADPNARHADNNHTPLHLAVKQDNIEAVKMLVQWDGCDVNIQVRLAILVALCPGLWHVRVPIVLAIYRAHSCRWST